MTLSLVELRDILQKNTKKLSDCMGMTTGTGCSSATYEDIIYVTSEKSFFLIPKTLSDRLKEGAAKLSEKVATTNKTERIQSLSESGLIQCLATPKLESFLNDADKKQYLDDKWLINDKQKIYVIIRMIYIDDAISKFYQKELNYYEPSKKIYGFDKLHPKVQSYLDKLAAKLKAERKTTSIYTESEVDTEWLKFDRIFSTEKSRYQTLDKKARQLATSASYVIQEDIIYTPEQVKIKELIDIYLENQETILRHEKLSAEDSRNIFQAIAYYKQELEKLKAKKGTGYYAFGTNANLLNLQIDASQKSIKTLTQIIQQQITTIVELANYGIAMPEFALGKKDPTQGLDNFHQLRSKQKQREDKADELKKQFDLWYKATGSRTAPPLAIFDPYVIKIAALDDDIEKIKTDAEQLADNLSPPMILFWDPTAFTPKQAEWLVKGNMPLRELTIASDQKELLSHISLYDIVTKGTALAEKLDKASQQISDLNKDNSLFTGYLKENQAYQIEIKEQWYNKDKGTFNADEFFKFLKDKGFNVKSIETEAQQKQWGNILNAIIFKESVQRHIMAFDNSLPAAFIRCLGGSKMAQASFEFSGPELSGGTLAGAELKLKISPAHGQVDLFNFDWPKPSEALSIVLPYYNYQGEQKELDFGHFYLNIRAKAWYFAGISLMLGAKVELAGDNGTLGIKVTDQVQSQPTAGAVAELELFAGVEGGMQLTCQLMWKSPPNINSAEQAYQKSLSSQSQSLQQVFRILFKGQVKTSISAGGALNGKCAFILKGGKLIFAFGLKAAWGFGGQAAAEFEVDYRCIMDIVQIVCQALIDNDMQPLAWVEDDAMDAILKMSLLGLAFPEVAYWTFWSITKIEAFYNSIFYSGNGGVIGYYMTAPEYQQQFASWFKNLPAQAIGPLLWSLTTRPDEFTIQKNAKAPDAPEDPGDADKPGYDDEKERTFSKDEAIVLQQQAVNLCLGWIKEQQDAPFSPTKPNRAQRLFEAAVRRMNSQGVMDTGKYSANNSYCTIRYDTLEWAMKILKPRDINLKKDSNFELDKFNALVKDLGSHIDNYCHLSPVLTIGLPPYYYKKDN